MTTEELKYGYLSEIAYAEALLNDCLEDEVETKLDFAYRIEHLKIALDSVK